MVKEISAGLIVFRKEDNKIYYLLLHKEAHGIYKEGWDFPKGLVERGEDYIKTAIRETKEEAGISKLNIIEGFNEEINFFFKRDNELISKTVKYFLAATDQKKVKISFEHSGYEWLGYNDAIKRLTSKTSKEILKNANDFIKKGITFNKSLISFIKNGRKVL